VSPECSSSWLPSSDGSGSGESRSPSLAARFSSTWPVRPGCNTLDRGQTEQAQSSRRRPVRRHYRSLTKRHKKALAWGPLASSVRVGQSLARVRATSGGCARYQRERNPSADSTPLHRRAVTALRNEVSTNRGLAHEYQSRVHPRAGQCTATPSLDACSIALVFGERYPEITS
jgi:hypothetical protein